MTLLDWTISSFIKLAVLFAKVFQPNYLLQKTVINSDPPFKCNLHDFTYIGNREIPFICDKCKVKMYSASQRLLPVPVPTIEDMLDELELWAL